MKSRNSPGAGGNGDPAPGANGGAKPKRTIRNAVLVGLLGIALVAGGFLFNLAQIWNTQTAKTEISAAPESPTQTATTKPSPTKKPAPKPVKPPPPPPLPMNILLIGSDHRKGDAPAPNGLPNQRADVLMLVHLAADGKHAYGISLMRDLWVPIPGYGEAKINASLEQGGMPLAVKTVESLFGQKIQHAVMIDFEGFRGITEALGGVDVNNPEAFTSTHDTRQHFPAGVNRLKGQRALEFVRERYAFVDGDYRRVANQQLFLRSTLAKLLSARTLTNPVTLYKLVNTAAKYITVDKGLNATALASLVYSLRNVRMQDAVFFTLPTAGFGTSTDGQSIILPDYGATAAVGAALGKDRLGQYAATLGK
ncbi:putative LytR family regulatory protein [Arthrobacter globiformis NBRC 12137]|uniref:Putative LytR family regulatory protein n=1 Tax=Arthrobacter globiformis (strain ATCC 8010 / DSM 20124 / JCM 1332 / NBRC 12137 / NCIMB 8907 / NRRL B-2979 / 168) TaxID=1077972 RepID=H0QGN9_ARTG1|nr:LCP family protein [Arthrobacter globiformis]GAB11990.1 putative LytR family regulatory protein [Arthrobacter globiformis NBRC 12137]